ncbi:hypothetical protein B0T14DRAFT_432639 [Immersiella caudata]|uniref:Uncharacterized protein n=1 Tax=Immersiella caudata TaxID=314043 RepID=A0AA39WS01_9PEZI|nr:hypothetical protein B0T14DRAFT_432639 [Immersiella caudata]
MQVSLATLLFAAAGFVSAAPQDNALIARQNQNRPVPNGQCCVANTSLKQDACRVNGQNGRCVPGGNNCGSRLSCVAQSSLTCDNNVIERGKSLCRANFPGGGFFDGANRISNLNQATVN